jgi:MoaA/NifB/PqqE/SkfB family radical SAM enzyme
MIVVWRVTERCNLACAFCAYDRRLVRSRRDVDTQNVMAFGQVLSDYQRVTGDQVLVSWMGGEPFVLESLKDLTVLFRNEFKLRISATTNGTLLGAENLREHILENYDELTFSVDAIGSVHNDLRLWRDGFASLRRAVIALVLRKRELNRRLKLRANIVLMRATVDHFEPLCYELATWGIDEITFNQLGGRDRPEFFATQRLLPDDVNRLSNSLPALREQLATAGVMLRGSDDYLVRIRATSSATKIPVADCSPGERFLFISETGTISPCHFTTEEFGLPIKHIGSVADLVALPVRFRTLKRAYPAVSCDDCHGTHIFSKFAA